VPITRHLQASLSPARCYRNSCTLPGAPDKGYVRLPMVEVCARTHHQTGPCCQLGGALLSVGRGVVVS
jgi:hypothetical protein